MKLHVFAAAAAASLSVSPGPAAAGVVERACMASDRGANRALCACIQQAADMTLTGRDQRRAAGFFRDPDRAQEVFLSQRAADDAFWVRYQAFGDMAGAYCAG